MEGALCLSGAAFSAALSSLLVNLLRPTPTAAPPAVAPVAAAPAAPPASAVYWPPPPPPWQPDPQDARGDTYAEPDSPRAGGKRRGSVQPAGGPWQSELNSHPEAVWEGWSMEEARVMSQKNAAKARELKPTEVLAELQRGNARFWTGTAARPERSAFERRALIMQQFPTVAVLGCSDSRVPTEIIFDQGLGDMFVVRVAGNCLDTTTHASLQYAVQHLKVKVVIVMGHEGCGAVKAAGLPLEKIEQEPPLLCQTLKLLKSGLEEERLRCVHDARAHDREAVVTNVKHQIAELTRDETFMEKVRNQELLVVGAFYEISSGIVDFFLEVTEEHNLPADRVVTPGLSKGVTSRFELQSPTSRMRTNHN